MITIQYLFLLFPIKFLDTKMRVSLFIKNVTSLSDPFGSMDGVAARKIFHYSAICGLNAALQVG